MTDCVHRWRISKPAPGEYLAGVCACGAWRLFEALAPSASGWRVNRKGQESRREEKRRAEAREVKA